MTDIRVSIPFQHSGKSVAQLMQLLLYALLPGILASLWFFGIGILTNIVIAVTFAWLAESAMLRLRNRNIRSQLNDGSALVSATLLATALPPGSPWWLPAIGVVFAIIIAKHLYGGLGQNPFNPAMCGYAMLLLAFPLEMSSWHIPQNIISGPLSIDNFPVPANIDQEFINPLNWESLKQSLQAAFPILITNSFDAGNLLDGMAMATPLMKFEMAGHSALLAALQSAAPVFARESGTAWEIINIAYLLGGLFLLYKRIISWHIPVSIIASVLFVSVLFYQAESAAIYGSPFLHLFGSATMLGAFFIATDPVSAATSRRGKIYYGIIIGISIYAIRVWGSYLDSIAFAVLFGNFCAPLLDHYCRPRIFGHPSNAVAKTTTYRKRPVK